MPKKKKKEATRKNAESCRNSNSTVTIDINGGPKNMDPREHNKCAMRVVAGETKEGQRTEGGR